MSWMKGYVFLVLFVLVTIEGMAVTAESTNNAPPSLDLSSIDGLKHATMYSQVDKHEYDFREYNCKHFAEALYIELNYLGFETGKAMIVIYDATEYFPEDVIIKYDDSAIFCHDVVWVNMNGEYIFIEPQTDEIISLSDPNYKEVLIINSTTEQIIEVIPC